MAASVVLALCVVAIGAAVTAANQSSAAVEGAAAARSVARADMEVLAAQGLSAIGDAGGAAQQTIDLTEHGGVTGDRATTSATIKYVSRSALQGNRDIAVVKVMAVTPDGSSAALYRIVTREGNGQ